MPYKDKEKQKEYDKRRYQENKEEEKLRNKKWHEEHPEYRKEYGKKYREEHPEYFKEYGKNWRAENKEHLREWSRNYRVENPDIRLKAEKRYRISHPGKIRVKNRNRRHRLKGVSDGTITLELEELLYEQQGGLCAYCKRDMNETGRHLDHIIPVSKGGLDTGKNVHWTCPTCNLSKGDKDEKEWLNTKKTMKI